MPITANKYLSVGTKVKVISAMDVPVYSVWDDDKGRISASLKKRLQGQFFGGNSKIHAEVVYIGNESEREKLRRKGLIKIRLRDPAGSSLTITADPNTLTTAR